MTIKEEEDPFLSAQVFILSSLYVMCVYNQIGIENKIVFIRKSLEKWQ